MSLDPYPSNEELLRIKAQREGRDATVFLRMPRPVEQKRPAKTRSVPTEHQEQRELFEWIDTIARRVDPEYGYIFAIPNGGYRTPASAGRAKAEGQRPGYPDIGWDLPRGPYIGFRGELKRQDQGALSAAQMEWAVWLDRQGFKVVACHGWEAMREELVLYHKLPLPPSSGAPNP